MRRSLFPAALPAALLALLPAPVLARSADETVFCVDTATNHILELDFDEGESTAINTDANARKRLRGLAARDDVDEVQLLATDAAAGAVILYDDSGGTGQVVAQGMPGASSVTMDGQGNLFVVGGSLRRPIIWAVRRGGNLVGGYKNPVVVDATLPSTRVAQALVYPAEGNGVLARDLFVLSEQPPLLYRYPRSAVGFDRRKLFLGKSKFPPGTIPTGLAFSPKGDILISTTSGRVLRYDKLGTRLSDFATNLPTGRSRITVGIQDRAPVAFLSAAGHALRPSFVPGGTAVIEDTIDDACSPLGDITMASNTVAPTAVGTLVKVSNADEVELTFDEVSDDGLTRTRFVEFADNRESPGPQLLDDFLVGRTAVQELVPDDLIVPAYVRAFPKRAATDPSEGPYTGPDTFIMAIVETTAKFKRTAEFHEDEADRLGYEPDCGDNNPALQPRTFYAPQTQAPYSEAALVEGPVLVDFSTDCGSNIGRGSNFSLWLTGRDARSLDSIIDDKYDNFVQAMSAYGTFIEDTREGEINAALAASRNAYDNANYVSALTHLQTVVAKCDVDESDFQVHPINIRGHLVARALSLRFMILRLAAS